MELLPSLFIILYYYPIHIIPHRNYYNVGLLWGEIYANCYVRKFTSKYPYCHDQYNHLNLLHENHVLSFVFIVNYFNPPVHQIVELGVHMDCEGCEKRVRKAISKLEGKLAQFVVLIHGFRLMIKNHKWVFENFFK